MLSGSQRALGTISAAMPQDAANLMSSVWTASGQTTTMTAGLPDLVVTTVVTVTYSSGGPPVVQVQGPPPDASFSATIDFGDGSAPTGASLTYETHTALQVSGGAGDTPRQVTLISVRSHFFATATHAYSQAGTYSASLEIDWAGDVAHDTGSGQDRYSAYGTVGTAGTTVYASATSALAEGNQACTQVEHGRTQRLDGTKSKSTVVKCNIGCSGSPPHAQRVFFHAS